MPQLPVILHISQFQVRGISYRSGFGGKSFETTASYSFESSDPRARLSEIIRFLDTNFEEPGAIYFNAPYEMLFFREFKLPFKEKKKIKEILPYELGALLPYEQDEIVYDTYIDITGNDSASIIAAGAVKETLAAMIQSFTAAGYEVQGIYSPVDALFQMSGFYTESNHFMLHLAPMVSMLTFIEENRLKTARVIPFGYREVIESIAEKTGKTAQEIPVLLKNLPVSNIEDIDYDFLSKHFDLKKTVVKAIVNHLEEFAKKLAREVRLSHGGDENRPDENKTSEAVTVLFSSEDSFFNLIKPFLEKEIDFSLQSFPHEKTALSLIDNKHLVEVGAMEGFTSGRGLNLLKNDLRKMAGSTAKRGWLWPAAVFAAAIFFVIFSFYIDMNNKQSIITGLEQEYEGLFKRYFGGRIPDKKISLVANARKLLKKERENTKIFRKFFTSPRFSRYLIAIHRAIPPGLDVYIERFDFNGKNYVISLNGDTADFDSMQQFKEGLLQSKFVKNTDSNERSKPARGGTRRVKFSIKIELNESVDEVSNAVN